MLYVYEVGNCLSSGSGMNGFYLVLSFSSSTGRRPEGYYFGFCGSLGRRSEVVTLMLLVCLCLFALIKFPNSAF